MRLDFIPLDKLSVSKANMRHGKKAPDVTDILPSIRKRGILQPLIVRGVTGEDESHHFEILADAAAIMPRCPSQRRRAMPILCPAPFLMMAMMHRPSKPR